MRINRLDLTRYGKFTDHSFDFGPAPTIPVTGSAGLENGAAALCDLHIIYGANEAGKSTTYSAILDLLFGIEARSRFNFLHPYPTMRIAANLQLNGMAQELVRVKKRDGLLDGTDRTLPETILTSALGDIDREAYRTMFLLDDDTLEQGGESILQSKGNLGELLFSASAGLASLSQSLNQLRAKADQFYKPNARSGGLVDLRNRLQELEAEKTRNDMLAGDYKQLVSTRDMAQADYDRALAERNITSKQIDEIQNLIAALPRLAQWQLFNRQMEPFESLPETPLGWMQELPQLQHLEIEHRTKMQAFAAELNRLEQAQAALPSDPAALAFADNVERLAGLKARFITAEKDLPERRLKSAEDRLIIATLLDRLDLSEQMHSTAKDNPRRLLLKTAVEAQLRSLIESYSGIEAQQSAAFEELAKARHRLHRAHGMSEQADTEKKVADKALLSGLAALPPLLARLRASGHATQLQLAERAYVDSSAMLAEQLRQLQQPYQWRGDEETLMELNPVSRAAVQLWQTAYQTAQTHSERCTQIIAESTAEFDELEAELHIISGGAAPVNDADIIRLREERDAAWQHHRTDLQLATALQFETLLLRDDAMVQLRLVQAADRARTAQLQQRSAVLALEIKRAEDDLAQANSKIAALRQQLNGWISAIAPQYRAPTDLDLTGGNGSDELLEWLGSYERALQLRLDWQQAERARDQAASETEKVKQSLRQGLALAGITHDPELDFEALLALAQTAENQLAQMQALQADITARQSELDERERESSKAAAAKQQWQREWEQICSACWLGEGETVPLLATVREYLQILKELTPVLDRYEELQLRIEKMEQDQALFAAEIHKIALVLQLSIDEIPVLDLATRINNRIEQACADQRQAQDLQQRLNMVQDEAQALTAKLAIIDQHKTEMTDYFGVSNLQEVDEKLRHNQERERLRLNRETEENELLTTLQVTNIDEAQKMLGSVERPVLQGELSTLELRFDEQDQQLQELYSRFKLAEKALNDIGGDDIVARLDEQRRTTLLEMEEEARHYLRLRFGISAAEQALRLYRDKHRSSMMARAGHAFATISQGVYRNLTTQPDKDAETLIAVGADGSSKTADELSKGTRFQLYLALRMAGYYEFVDARRPLPFIADDIMETFDDDRSRETFKLFAQMAQRGQVIYLTHHQHLCDIAREVCPQVQIHHL